MGLQRLRANFASRPLYGLIEPKLSGPADLDLAPSYQRGSVWTRAMRRRLFRSLFIGLPIGAICLNRRTFTGPQYVVDGKQRLETLRLYRQDGFALPRDWFPDRYLLDEKPAEVGWNDLNRPAQRFIENLTVATMELDLPTEAQEREVYVLINTAGVPHDADEFREDVEARGER